jgi:predicted regulator of Ras-like GTPase activity (Roadblock/LC7/MglB family)
MELNGYLEDREVREEDLGNNLEALLNMFLIKNPHINAAAIITTEGLPIISAISHRLDETRVAAMTATLLSLAERAIEEMERGDFNELFIKGTEGYLILVQAGPNAVLMLSTSLDVQLGLLFFESERICEKIAYLL